VKSHVVTFDLEEQLKRKFSERNFVNCLTEKEWWPILGFIDTCSTA